VVIDQQTMVPISATSMTVDVTIFDPSKVPPLSPPAVGTPAAIQQYAQERKAQEAAATSQVHLSCSLTTSQCTH
jgi:hypothetical protein